jgi:S-DNA-T family DNA segregation ATPase FtsK/SpoIIIE
MAKQTNKKKKNNTKKSNNESYFIISLEKKKKILGIILSVLALLIFLSILSYSRADQDVLTFESSELSKVISPDRDFEHRAESVHNWLGLFGAYISNFLINSTIGYFAIVFPVILFIFGYSIIVQNNYKLSLYLSNFLILAGLILATFFGLLRMELEVLAGAHELSGKIGDFLGEGLGIILGGLGGIIFLLALILITTVIVFDVNLEKIFAFFKDLWMDEEGEKKKAEKKAAKEENLDNISKIKELREEKPKKKKSKPKEEKEPEPEEPPKPRETQIRIVKSESEELPEGEPEELNKAFERERKNKEESSDKDSVDPVIDKDKEAKLPEQWEENINYKMPSYSLMKEATEEELEISDDELTRNAELLKEKLSLFDIEIEDISVTPGPVVTLYEIVPAPGVKISRIVNLEHDIALALAARGIRIIAPIPGKSAIGVEIPNAKASLVTARSVITKIKETKAELTLALGKTIIGEVYITDLATMPHMLIAGSTGAGKSVGINIMLMSLLYSKHPSDIKFVIIDPKKIELSFYSKLTNHYLAVSPDLDENIITTPQNALLALKAVEYEMEKRYDKLAKLGVRNIVDYNKKVTNPKTKPKDTDDVKYHKMPYLIVVIDELADLMMTSGKEVEEPITRLAQLARAVGIHLIVATQRPSVNVITGTIKANFSARAAYQVATKVDSRTILDMNGAEQLLGRGDLLFLPGGQPKPIRIQNAFISTEEVEKITNYIYTQPGYSKRYFLPSMFEKKSKDSATHMADLDPMFEDAARLIVKHDQGSVSLIQRKLKLGYARAARIVDQLEETGIVGPSEGSKAREVLVEDEEHLETILRSL